MTFIHNLSPILVKLGPLEIRWYGLMYVFAFLATLWYLRKASRENKISLSYDNIDSLMTWLVVGMIIGARLFAVFFWNPTYYFSNPLEIPAVWKGGLSFHGGFLGILIAGILFCRRKKINFLNLCDVIIVPLSLGQAFGRFGNFMNSELYGPATNLSWGVNFLSETNTAGSLVFRHPTMLYELLYNLIIFSVLFAMSRKKLKTGTIFGTFLILYSIFRTLTEIIRIEDVYIGPLTMSQALNIPMFIAGIYLLCHQVYKLRQA
ncbi:MAG: prolipoprotein diacylglyceryl transferase [Candidatus Aenigmarchaeota archaeon]|nr:prolipoprotein diacylglyceryl transferase [Candidatus Aenigmarchaeota archaeon]